MTCRMALAPVIVGLLSVLVLPVLASKVEDNVNDLLDSVMADQPQERHRQKRSLGGGSGACMAIYTVPKQTMQCEPSQEVQDDLTAFKQSLADQVTSLEGLTTRLDNLEPDQPRDIPPEIRERLDQIVTVRETQASHGAAFSRVDAEIRHLAERITTLDAADRQQVAYLIEQQTHLIKVTLHQSNMTLHEEYVDRLTESTRQLTDRLRQLEGNLRERIEEAEGRLQQTVTETERVGRSSLAQTKDELTTRITAFEQKLTREEQTRHTYQVKTEENTDEMEKLLHLLTMLREHQASYEQDKEQLREIIRQLSTSLSEERERTEQLRNQVNSINASLTNSQTVFAQFRRDLIVSNNLTTALDDHLLHLQRRMDEKEHLLPRTLKVADCRDALAYYYPTTGVYPVNPGQAREPFNAYCDMEDGQGWTLLLRRQDGSTDFYRDWNAYKTGFGDLDAEHWLGLEKVYSMTSRKQYKLRVDLQDWDRKWWYAEYDSFRIDAEDAGYMLHVSGYHGNAGDSMRFHDNMGFSTHDRSYDKNDGICARWCHGAWWYRDCFHSNLNGRYYTAGTYKTTTGWGDGIVWRELRGTNFYSVKAVIMKITPVEKLDVEEEKANTEI